METISPTPIPEELTDYTEVLNEIKGLLEVNNDLSVPQEVTDYTTYFNELQAVAENQYELMQGQYVATLFCIGVVGATFVLVLLYKLLKKCY